MLAVVTVLRTKGMLWVRAVRARISQDFGHIRLCRPTGAIPNGMAYSRPKREVLSEAPW